MLTLIEGLSVLQIAVGILHELVFGALTAEAVSVAFYRCIDGAIGLHILVVGEAPSTHIVELAGRRIGGTGKADEEYAS